MSICSIRKPLTYCTSKWYPWEGNMHWVWAFSLSANGSHEKGKRKNSVWWVKISHRPFPRGSECSKHTLKNFLLSSKIPCTRDFQNITRTVHKYSLKSLVAAYLFLSTRDVYVKYFLNTDSCRSLYARHASWSKWHLRGCIHTKTWPCNENAQLPIHLQWDPLGSSCGGHRLCCRLVRRPKLSDLLVANGRVTLWLPIKCLTLLY